MAQQESSITTGSLASDPAATGPSAASHLAPPGQHQQQIDAQPMGASMSGLSNAAPSAAASAVANGASDYDLHPHQDCTSAVRDGAPVEMPPMPHVGHQHGDEAVRSAGFEAWGSGGAEPGFSTTAPLLTAAADAGHSCNAGPCGAQSP